MSCSLINKKEIKVKVTPNPADATATPEIIVTDAPETAAPATEVPVPETLAPVTGAPATAVPAPETLAPVTNVPATAAQKTAAPTATSVVTSVPTVKPTAVPTKAPTAKPTVKPTATPAPKETAHVIFLLGQSNAVGATLHCLLNPIPLRDGKTPAIDAATYSKYLSGVSSKVKMIYYAEAGGSDGQNYQCNPTNLSAAVTKTPSNLFKTVKLGMSYTTDHFGPEVGMAVSLSQKYPNEKFYIIKAAKGGISINPYWKDSGFCYTKMKQLWEIALQSFELGNMVPEVDAIVWVQGENEATSASEAANYYSYESDLAARLRKYFAPYAKQGGIRFVSSGISNYWGNYQTVNAAKKQFADSSSLNYFFSPQDHGYTWDTDVDGNYAHWDAKYVLELGKELGKLCY